MRVLVTGACGPVGRTLLDQLVARGVHVVGADMSPTPRPDGVTVVGVLPASDPGYVDQLAALVAEHDIDLLIPTVSEELPIVAAAKLPQTVIAPLEGIAAAHDKWLTSSLLAAAGIAVPHSAQASQVTESLAQMIGVPYIIKPRVSRGGRGVRLLDEWPPPEGISEGEIVSEFAPGREYCVDVFIAGGPSADVAITMVKTGLKSGNHGNATGVQVVDDPDVTDLAVAACRELGLTGPADIDIRRRENGEPVVLEINARFGANSAHAPEILDAVLAEAQATTRTNMKVPA